MLECSRRLSVLALLLGIGLGCAGPSPPRALLLRELPAASERTLFLVAAREKQEIARQLEAAGFTLAERLIDAPFLLRVTIGVPLGFRSCGDLRNVKFALNQSGENLLELSDRGWTGSCEASVYTSLSAALGEQFDAAAQRGARD